MYKSVERIIEIDDALNAINFFLPFLCITMYNLSVSQGYADFQKRYEEKRKKLCFSFLFFLLCYLFFGGRGLQYGNIGLSTKNYPFDYRIVKHAVNCQIYTTVLGSVFGFEHFQTVFYLTRQIGNHCSAKLTVLCRYVIFINFIVCFKGNANNVNC